MSYIICCSALVFFLATIIPIYVYCNMTGMGTVATDSKALSFKMSHSWILTENVFSVCVFVSACMWKWEEGRLIYKLLCKIWDTVYINILYTVTRTSWWNVKWLNYCASLTGTCSVTASSRNCATSDVTLQRERLRDRPVVSVEFWIFTFVWYAISHTLNLFLFYLVCLLNALVVYTLDYPFVFCFTSFGFNCFIDILIKLKRAKKQQCFNMIV